MIIITINIDAEERDMKILNGEGSLTPLLQSGNASHILMK